MGQGAIGEKGSQVMATARFRIIIRISSLFEYMSPQNNIC